MKHPLTTVVAFAIGFGAVAAYNTPADAAPICNGKARILCVDKQLPLPVPTRPVQKPYKKDTGLPVPTRPNTPTYPGPVGARG